MLSTQEQEQAFVVGFEVPGMLERLLARKSC